MSMEAVKLERNSNISAKCASATMLASRRRVQSGSNAASLGTFGPPTIATCASAMKIINEFAKLSHASIEGLGDTYNIRETAEKPFLFRRFKIRVERNFSQRHDYNVRSN